VAAIWAEVLRVERVGRHDDFFALGGHSLLAMQIVARIRRAFDLELPLTRVFERPTLAHLADEIDALLRRGAPGPVSSIRSRHAGRRSSGVAMRPGGHRPPGDGR
jgi:acyl carrier protein